MTYDESAKSILSHKAQCLTGVQKAGNYLYRHNVERTLAKMKIKAHSLAAVPLAAGIYLGGGSGSFALGAALCSIFIDLDHIPEYLSGIDSDSGLKIFMPRNKGMSPHICSTPCIPGIFGWLWPFCLSGRKRRSGFVPCFWAGPTIWYGTRSAIRWGRLFILSPTGP